ncbi:hypothetical protein BCR35DRAFT_298021 [Leucosporidium creatinivorum]|uniref:Uncharacterized protein n=1 Tax=Leucosporidium creatinivorum TaxID=106004 RepID=A0A1Y2G3N5_9BASI|nr:hypothetical protein BCR35DRAFT_298021 [Leucosporidium creatinivorum]
MALLLNATLDDFAANFNWSSAWTAPDTSAVGYPNGDSFLETLVDGTYHETASANTTTSLSFAGSALYLYGVAGPSQGFYTLNLDNGATSAPLSAFASANSSNHLLWSAVDLAEGDHTLEITNLGQNGDSSVGESLLIDYALLTVVAGAEGATLTNTTIEDSDHARLTYEGSWTVNNDTRFSGNTSSYTNEQQSVSLKFNGSVVYVYGDTVDDHGLYTVDLDGVSKQYQGYTAELKIGTLMYFAAGLDESEHTLTITNDPGSAGTYFDLDSIVYTTPSAYAVNSPSSPSSSSVASRSGSPTSSGSPSSSSTSTPASEGSRAKAAFLTVLLLSVAVAALAGSA